MVFFKKPEKNAIIVLLSGRLDYGLKLSHYENHSHKNSSAKHLIHPFLTASQTAGFKKPPLSIKKAVAEVNFTLLVSVWPI
jgi:hypothetical protein